MTTTPAATPGAHALAGVRSGAPDLDLDSSELSTVEVAELVLLGEIRDELRRLNTRVDAVHALAVTAHDAAAPHLAQLGPHLAQLGPMIDRARSTRLGKALGL